MTNFDVWLVILCMFGFLVALVGAELLNLDPAASALEAAILREAARITLAIAITGAAMRLPTYWLRLNWRELGVSLVPGVLPRWGAGSAVAAATPGRRRPGCGCWVGTKSWPPSSPAPC